MHLAASDAPAAVKRRVVEPVNKVKILPIFWVSNARFLSNLFQFFIPQFDATVSSYSQRRTLTHKMETIHYCFKGYLHQILSRGHLRNASVMNTKYSVAAHVWYIRIKMAARLKAYTVFYGSGITLESWIQILFEMCCFATWTENMLFCSLYYQSNFAVGITPPQSPKLKTSSAREKKERKILPSYPGHFKVWVIPQPTTSVI
jgi:hypothetical protein